MTNAGACIVLGKQLGLSVSAMNMMVKNHHVIEENADQCGHSQTKESKQSKISHYSLKQ
jgi:hypothetical protein